MSAQQVSGLNARTVANLEAVLFDLDGTLIDTAADIAYALNRALAEQDLGSCSERQVREMIGRGVPTLIERAVARLGHGAAVDRALLEQRFHAHYGQLLERGEYRAQLYAGVAEGLGALALRLRLAVVTNKPQRAAATLLARCGLGHWIEMVVGGDSCLSRKPHPQPLLLACEALRVAPAQALMVGDSLTDVLAARAAGMAVVCVPYGYNEGADARALPCDALVETLHELPALLGRAAAGAAVPGAATVRADA